MAQARAALRPPPGAAAKVAAAARAAASKISDAAAAAQMKASPTGPSPTGRQLLQARGAPHDTGAAGKRASHAELLLEEAKAKFARPTNDGADRRDGAQHGGAAGGEQHAMEGVGMRGMWREAAELAARGVPNADNFGPASWRGWRRSPPPPFDRLNTL